MSEEGGVRSDGLACLRENLIPMPTFFTLSLFLTRSLLLSLALLALTR